MSAKILPGTCTLLVLSSATLYKVTFDWMGPLGPLSLRPWNNVTSDLRVKIFICEIVRKLKVQYSKVIE